MNSKKCLVIIIGVVVMSSISMFSEEKGKEVYEVELSSGVVENEVYEERVVVRGRWGVGAGEFGIAYAYVSRNENLIEPIKPLQDPVYPKSLAVDSRGNIYILDVVNNRIQKFSNDGRYILEIPVESFIGAKVIKKEYKEFDEYKVEGLVKTLGVNIVIDSQDNLYYYCVKQEYDKDKGIMVAKKGEVWMFKDDKLVKRWEDSVPKKGYVIRKKDDNQKIVKHYKELEIEIPENSIKEILIRTKDKEIKLVISTNEYPIGKEGIEFLDDERICFEVCNGQGSFFKREIFIFDVNKTKFKKVIGIPSLWYLKQPYFISSINERLEVRKYVRKK